jgi:hypothetical protein
MIATLAGVQEMRARSDTDPTALLARMTTAFAVGQIAGPVFSSLLLYLPALAAHGLDFAFRAAAAALLLSSIWLWRQAGHSPIRKEAVRVP